MLRAVIQAAQDNLVNALYKTKEFLAQLNKHNF
jgi:hypothetical protein